MYLITGAGGGVGSVSRTVVELLLDSGEPVRAMVRRDDERAQQLRAGGADVVIGDLTRAADIVGAIATCWPPPRYARWHSSTATSMRSSTCRR